MGGIAPLGEVKTFAEADFALESGMQNSFLSKISAAHLRKAAQIRQKMEDLEKELTGLIGIPEQLTVGHLLRKKRRLSAAGRQRISDATRERWAKLRAAKKK